MAMSDIFLSYAREDLKAAAPIVQTLEGKKWSGVLGSTYTRQAKFGETCLSRSYLGVECVVVLWSRTSVSSDWVLEEAEYGRGRRILIPVLIEVAVQPPLGFRAIQAADLSRWTGDQKDPAIQQFLLDLDMFFEEITKRKDEEQQLQLQIAETKRAAEERQHQQAQAEARRKTEKHQRELAEKGEASRQQENNREPVDSETTTLVGRNIVLLSDGTGNFVAKFNRTNISRFYLALDLRHGDQIAFYDNGLLTSGVWPIGLLCGVFGWGLSHSILDLYEFLCRHYRAGDRIYIFGFGRGAFTARTLAALIGTCGVLDRSKAVPGGYRQRLQLSTREGLKAGVRLAYCSYRRGYHAPVTHLFRKLRDLMVGPMPTPEVVRANYSTDVIIKFIGVWDTVDAVRMPINALSTMVDRIFYPGRFPDYRLSPQVERACHAIAVDEGTFVVAPPLLWDERGNADSERITQVWFSGRHFDIGGGCYQDELSYLSLKWMTEQALQCGLRFNHSAVRMIASQVQPFGKMHESRRGLACIISFSRDISQVCVMIVTVAS